MHLYVRTGRSPSHNIFTLGGVPLCYRRHRRTRDSVLLTVGMGFLVVLVMFLHIPLGLILEAHTWTPRCWCSFAAPSCFTASAYELAETSPSIEDLAREVPRLVVEQGDCESSHRKSEDNDQRRS